MGLVVLDYINLSLALMSIIPVVILFRQYLVTRFHDYLIFSSIFISSFFSFSFNLLAGLTDLLIFYKLHHVSLNFSYFFIFLHAIRINQVRTYSLRRILGFLWFTVLIVLIFYWKKYEHPNSARVLFWNMSKSNISYDPQGAGLITGGGIVIYSTQFRIIAEAYYIFTISMLFLIYLRVEPIHPTKEIMTAKKLWVIASGLILVFWLSTLPFLPQSDYIKLLALVSIIIIAYIGIKIPEGILISHTQITRAYSMYKKYNYFKMVEGKSKVLETVIDYIESIPKKIIDIDIEFL